MITVVGAAFAMALDKRQRRCGAADIRPAAIPDVPEFARRSTLCQRLANKFGRMIT